MGSPELADGLAVPSIAQAPAQAPGSGEIAASSFVLGISVDSDAPTSDLERIRAQAAAFFGTLTSYLPDTSVTILMGMEGAANLSIAEIALDKGLSVDALLAVLPDQRVADFDDINQRLFNKIVSSTNVKCTGIFAPPSDSSGTEIGPHAVRQALGDVLIRRSNLLMALWDGKPAMRPEGTANTLLRFLRIHTPDNPGAPALEGATSEVPAGTDSPFVYWIPIAPDGPRGDATPNPNYLTGLGEAIVRFGEHAPGPLRAQLEELNDYNRDLQALAAGRRGTDGQPESLLAGAPSDLTLDEGARLARMDAEYRNADTLALYYQKRSDSLFGLFGVVAFCLGCLYLIYDQLGEQRAFLAAYLVILLGSLAMYRLLYTKLWFVKHLRYRALAETMRVKFFLSLAGVDRGVDAAEVMALSGIERFEGFGWFGFVLSSFEIAGGVAGRAPDSRRIDYVRDAWVNNQRAYFTRKVAQLEHKSRLVDRGQRATLAIMIVVLLLRMILGDWLLVVHVIPKIPLKNLLVFCVGISALFLGAWKLHQSKMATRELIWQYRNQLGHFSRIHSELERTLSPQRRSALLVELARQSLMESYLWTIHRYHREHAPPGGG